MKNKRIIFGFFVLFAISLSFAHYQVKRHAIEEAAIPFFSYALRAAHVREDVALEDITYQVNDGAISQAAQLSSHQTFIILSTAYERALARRNPLLGIEGTDTDSLAQALHKLEATQHRLAEAQTSKEDAAKIEHLYPINFLHAIVDLERARGKFLKSGTSADNALYETRLRRAIAAGTHDAETFKTMLDDALGTSTVRFPTLGGMISESSLSAAMRKIIQHFHTYAAMQDARARCVTGHIDACDPHDIQLPIMGGSGATPRLPFIASEIRSMMRSATGYSGKEEILALTASECLHELPGPYFFWIRPDGNSPVGYARFLNDIYFAPTAHSKGSTLSYLASRGISYSPVNATAFYMCPNVEKDFGDMHATRAAYSLFSAEPQLASLYDIHAGSDLFIEDHARAFLSAIIDQLHRDSSKISTEVLRSTEAVALMFTEKNAALDIIVLQASLTGEGDANLKQEGIPFDISARTLILTHSAFPSFFLSSNVSAAEKSADPTSGSAVMPLLLSQYRRYSDLRAIIPQEKILSDIRTFFDFEARSRIDRIPPQK